MPGLYLLMLAVSIAGVAVLDARFGIAFWRSPRRSALSVLLGTLFFLAWDAVGIATGVFVKGDSPLLLGIDLAPHLPLEEPVFLAFLCYLALLISQTALSRGSSARRGGPAKPTDGHDDQTEGTR